VIEERYIELMNQEIDGANSPAESSALHTYLSTHPEGQSYYNELLELEETFDEIRSVPPPPELRAAILAEIQGSGEATERRGIFNGIFDAFRFSPRMAYAFAAGLIIGIGLFAILSRVSPVTSPGDVERLYGTLADTGATAPFPATEPVTFDLPGGSGSVRARSSGNATVAEINLSTDTQVQIFLEFGEHVRFDGFRALDSGDHTMQLVGNQAELTHSGVGNYAVILRDDTRSCPPIHLRAFAAGDLLFEREIRPGAE
jgi:hypothetical protein